MSDLLFPRHFDVLESRDILPLASEQHGVEPEAVEHALDVGLVDCCTELFASYRDRALPAAEGEWVLPLEHPAQPGQVTLRSFDDALVPYELGVTTPEVTRRSGLRLSTDIVVELSPWTSPKLQAIVYARWLGQSKARPVHIERGRIGFEGRLELLGELERLRPH